MTVFLHHTIVAVPDAEESAAFVADILGLAPPTRRGPFSVVHADNGVSLDFLQTEAEVASQHYAFEVSDDAFDAIFQRILERGLDYWADPAASEPGRITSGAGGRGLSFEGPGGHYLEILTRPGGAAASG